MSRQLCRTERKTSRATSTNPTRIAEEVFDPAANKFDLLGRTLYSVSCDAGARWSFSNVVGNPIRVWDSRDHVIRSVYDDLHRRIELWVKAGSADEVLAEQTIYGEGQTDPEASNLRGKVYQVKDGAGVVTNVSYDFKGNLLSSQRQLAVAYSTQLDWSDTVTLETETFVQTTVYDALNRPTSITMPDSSEILPIYNEAGLLESVTAHVRGATGLTTFVDDIDYDAKGQREKIVYGNGVYTEYTYDPETYRVKRIKTTRDSDDEILQDLRYTYDAVGNIVEVADLAHETFYHGGHEIKAVWQYEYDALYRLTYATGREHVGTNDDIQQDDNGFPLVNGANPNDPSAMRNYEEWFEYDQVGNILKMIHDAQSSVGDWTRHYHVAETSNRLLDTSLPGDDEEDAVYSAEYTHDAHGNMLTMPHLSDGIEWDFKDQMCHVDKGGGGDVYFVYDASGQRIRKVWEHSGIIEERIYLGGFELYRRHESGDVVLERETLHIMDDAQRIAMVETKTIDEAADPFTITPRIRYQLGNHLGSAMLELDDEGLVISYEEYHPYGTSAYRAVDDSIEVSAKRYRYTGKERDEETGLYYHGARYYACWLGRWTSADPAGMVDGPNLYQYVRGRPVGSSDPSGMEESKAQKYIGPYNQQGRVKFDEAQRKAERNSIPAAPIVAPAQVKQTLDIVLSKDLQDWEVNATFRDLQRLTSDRLVLQQHAGGGFRVGIAEYAKAKPEKPIGTRLIRTFINSGFTVNIRRNYALTPVTNSPSGTSKDIELYYGQSVQLYTKGVGEFSELEYAPDYITLGHELIHAQRIASRDRGEGESLKYQYIDEKGNLMEHMASRTELEVIGIRKPTPKWQKATENALRREHGLRARVSYVAANYLEKHDIRSVKADSVDGMWSHSLTKGKP